MRLPILAALLVLSCAARAGQIVVVSPASPAAPYKEALQGVCDALGSCPTVVTADDDMEIPTDARIVITLGGQAARQSFPARVVLVTALSPGYEARERPGSGAVVRVRMTLAPDEFVRRLLSLKPEAKSAALLWSEPSSGRFASNVRAAAAPLGIEVRPVKVLDPDALPALLRGLPPTGRLVARAGLRAGAAAREALAGVPPTADAYPQSSKNDPLADILASTRTPAGR